MANRVGFILKQGSTQAVELLAELGPRWIKRGLTVVLLEGEGIALPGAKVVPESLFSSAIDLLVVLGGDGTLLWASALLDRSDPQGADNACDATRPPQVPILGVNLGTLGFLTAFLPVDAEQATFAALAGTLPVYERMRLCVEVERTNGKRERHHALNDCVISQGALARLLDLEVCLGDERITTYKADGLIIATPTGSTAYNLAAGGPILAPHLEAIVLTPICPHTLTNRPLVLPGSSQVIIRPGPIPPVPARPSRIVVTIDGHRNCELGLSDRVLVSRATHPLRIVGSKDRSYFEVLRQKLRWGER